MKPKPESRRVFHTGERVKVQYIDEPSAYYEAKIIGSIGSLYRVEKYRIAKCEEPEPLAESALVRETYLVDATRVFK